jgi:hypothetical protein
MTNNSMLDGVDNNERINALIMVHPSVESIETVQIFANAYPASLGQAGGGVINVLSRSGTDAFHGSLYEYFRNDLLDTYPYQFGARNPKPKLRQNQYGASLGGPLATKRTHFFADYEGFRLIQGRAPTVLTVPTAYQHDHPGDFSDVGGPMLASMDTVGLAYFSLYPVPNVAGSSNQFVSAPSGSNLAHSADLRIDQGLRSQDKIYGRFSVNRTSVSIPGQFPSVQRGGITLQPGGSLTSYPGDIADFSVNTVLAYTHVFRPNLLLELKAGYTFLNEVSFGLNSNVAANQSFGQPNINLPSTSNGLAPINVVQASPLGTDGLYRPSNQLDNTFQYGGVVRWTRGRHAFSTGSSLVRKQWSNFGSGAGLGSWTVADLPSLLRGNFLQVYREVDLVVPHFRLWDFSAYLQDEWKLTSRFGVSLGLHYDLMTQPTEVRNQLGNFDFSAGKIVLAGQEGVSPTADVRSDRANFAPRIGFEWGVRPSTTLRGGYGLVYFRPESYFVFANQPFVYTFGLCSSQTCPGGYNTLAAGLPVPARPDISNPSGVLTDNRAFDLHASAMHQFNLGIEEQFGGNTVSFFYVSAVGRNIGRTFRDYNAPPPNTSSTPNVLRPLYPRAPELTAVGYRDSKGSSSYNAMQARFTHASQNGLTANVNYTLAHGLDNVSAGGFGTVPSLSTTLDYGNSNIDVRHRVVATVFYDLPFGKNINGPRAFLERGWQVNLAGVWSTGLPFTVLNANNVSNTNPGTSGVDRSDLVGDPSLSSRSVKKFFNTDAFRAQLPGTLGNERSNQLYGPSNRHLDGSLFKNFAIHKETTLQFRTEVFNLTNTANFAAPAAILGGSNFGQLTQLTGGYSPREIQFALKLQF